MLTTKWKPEQDFEGLFFLGALRQVILINLHPIDVMNHPRRPTCLQQLWILYSSAMARLWNTNLGEDHKLHKLSEHFQVLTYHPLLSNF